MDCRLEKSLDGLSQNFDEASNKTTSYIRNKLDSSVKVDEPASCTGVVTGLVGEDFAQMVAGLGLSVGGFIGGAITALQEVQIKEQSRTTDNPVPLYGSNLKVSLFMISFVNVPLRWASFYRIIVCITALHISPFPFLTILYEGPCS